jgi:hypothetical protein
MDLAVKHMEDARAHIHRTRPPSQTDPRTTLIQHEHKKSTDISRAGKKNFTSSSKLICRSLALRLSKSSRSRAVFSTGPAPRFFLRLENV